MPHILVPRRLCIQWALGITALSGCGTILFPERRGQPAGILDWKVVALDGIGLLFFFVPGVIAFAVDFSNGTIYLPPGEYTNSPADRECPLTSRTIPRGELSLSKINVTVSDHLQRPFRLSPGEYQTDELECIEEFWSVHDQFIARANL